EHPAARGAELRFWDEEGTASGGPILELAAGSGRVAIGLARKGHHVTGLELSPGMIERAEARAAHLPPEVRARLRWVQGDMTRFALPGERFGLIFVAYNSFWLLSTLAKQRACLARVRAHLAKGGRFVLDLFPPTVDDRMDEDGMTQYLPMAYRGQTVVRVKDYAWDEARKLAISNVRYYGEKHVTGEARRRSRRLISEFRYVLRLAPPEQVRALLAREGFEVQEEYGSYARDPLEDGAARAIFVCGLKEESAR
ncbi:MAG TPA: class I SAM-dependent methyltransferase, partial [Chloroflexota bacterium]|nr:class I SAM-dependent methyltransferase [Chloroflexota bacterium]